MAAHGGAHPGARKPSAHTPRVTRRRRSRCGLLVATVAGHVVHANRRCAELLDSRGAALVGAELGVVLGDADVAARMTSPERLPHPGGKLLYRWYNRRLDRKLEARVRIGRARLLITIRERRDGHAVTTDDPRLTALSGLSTGIVLFDGDQRCTWWNAAAAMWMEHAGAGRGDARDVFPGVPAAAFDHHFRQALDGRIEPIGDVPFGTRDGRRLWAAVTLSPTRDPGGGITGVCAEIYDVTARRRAEAVARRRACHDSLTGLVNRAHFMHRLRRMMKRGRRQGDDRFGVLYLDLDRFKNVNDAFGHEVGDRVLACVGRRLRAAVRPEDTVARLGGDEFAVLLSAVASDDAARDVAARLADALSKPIVVGTRVITVGASVGAATGAVGHATAQAVLAVADRAMYRDKAERARSPAAQLVGAVPQAMPGR